MEMPVDRWTVAGAATGAIVGDVTAAYKSGGLGIIDAIYVIAGTAGALATCVLLKWLLTQHRDSPDRQYPH